MDPILSLKDVSILYPGDQTDIRAVRNVSLDVAQGETLGLVGESGSGKSSLAAAMLGLLPAGARIKGSVHFEDHEMTALSEADLRQLRGSAIASIAQDPFTALNPVLRIGSQMVAFQHWHTGKEKECDKEIRDYRAGGEIYLSSQRRDLLSQGLKFIYHLTI